MSSAAYRSALAGDIEGFLAHKRSLGYAYESRKISETTKYFCN